MTDDTTSITTVSDDEIGSWEDRYERGSALALSHPPFSCLEQCAGVRPTRIGIVARRDYVSAMAKTTKPRNQGTPRSSLSGRFLALSRDVKAVSKRGSITQQQANNAVRSYLTEGKNK